MSERSITSQGGFTGELADTYTPPADAVSARCGGSRRFPVQFHR